MDLKIRNILEDRYHLSVVAVERQIGGWASLAYKVTSIDNAKYFLKIYEKERSSTEKLISGIDSYIPVIDYLNAHYSLKGKIVSPIRTWDGCHKHEDTDEVYLLFKYIEGVTIGDGSLSLKQIHQLADILAEMHSITTDLPNVSGKVVESFEIEFLDEFKDFLLNHNVWNRELKNILTSTESLEKDLNTLLDLSESFKNQEWKFVLCHTDIHHWNLMYNPPNLILIDWEGLKFAPREADFCLLQRQPYFSSLLHRYSQWHVNYSVDRKMLKYYGLKRNLEDIWEFIQQLQFDTFVQSERKIYLGYLREELTRNKNFHL